MAVNFKIICCVSWFVALTTTVKGYKSCAEIQDAKKNISTPYFIELDKKQVEVSCNLTSQPAVTTIVIEAVVQIPNPAAYSSPQSYAYNVNYGSVSLKSIRALIDQSEVCKQYVSYKCTNATLFGNSKSALSTWTSISDSPHDYWAGCSFSGKKCQCDQEKGMSEDAGYLTNKKDLPVKGLQIGGLSANSNVSVLIGNIMCYGDDQKGAVTLENRNAFVSLNVSSMKELKFKFKLLKAGQSETIAVLRIANKKNITIRVDSDSSLKAGRGNFKKVNNEWHSIVLNVEGRTFFAIVDNGKKEPIFESEKAGTGEAKLVLGDSERNCNTFIGCIKDLTVDGQDYTSMIRDTKMREFVKEGCKLPQQILCTKPKVLDVDTVSGIKTPVSGSNGGTSGPNTTTPCINVDGGGGGNDDAAIIAIVVVFLILLIILIVVFAITWYLKRNKGVYQTHEGSAENLHGDTDNITLVTKPGEQDTENGKGKEYYL